MGVNATHVDMMQPCWVNLINKACGQSARGAPTGRNYVESVPVGTATPPVLLEPAFRLLSSLPLPPSLPPCFASWDAFWGSFPVYSPLFRLAGKAFLASASAGDWTFESSSSRIYYVLRPGQTAATLAGVVPTLEVLVSVTGAGTTFEGITFEYVAGTASALSFWTFACSFVCFTHR